MEQSSGNITFTLRTGQKVVHWVGIVLFLFMIALGSVLISNMIGESIICIAIFWVLFIGAPLAGGIIFGLSLARAKLTFSDYGIFFQGPFKSINASWDEVKGFIDDNFGEVFLRVERMEGNKPAKRDIPLSWFSKISLHKPFKQDTVFESLINFAPQLTGEDPHTRGDT